MKTSIILAVAIALTVLGSSKQAFAYPQYQLNSDKTCTGCHLAPDGGGILNENGVNTSEATAWHAGDGNFMYGMNKPSWLDLGGDARAAAGFVYPGTASAAAYPMQAELAASVHWSGFSIHALGGFRRPQDNGSLLHVVW